MLTAEELKERLKGISLQRLFESPYYASLQGDAIEQFEKLLPEVRKDDFDLENVRPIVMADYSLEVESMMKNFDQTDEVDYEEVLERTTSFIDELYKSFNLPNT